MAMSAALIARPSRKGLDGVEAERDPEATGRFVLPSVADPALYVKTHLHARYDTEGLDERLRFAKGTTTLGFKYQGGVIISVDSRSTQGPYVASGSVKKVIEINPHLLGTMAGGAADCAFWERNLGRQCRLHQLREGRRITVAAASKLLANTLASYRGYGLSVGTMVAGWDEGPKGKAQLYYVDNDGLRFQAKDTMPYFSVGSGSTFAYGVLDSGYKWDMTDEEAVELGQRAIYHATHRDAYSGGFNNVYHVRQEGWKQVKHQDVFELHDMFGVDARVKEAEARGEGGSGAAAGGAASGAGQ